MDETQPPNTSSSTQQSSSQPSTSEPCMINLAPSQPKEQIKEIHIYDFDGTLFDTPTPDKGYQYHKILTLQKEFHILNK